MPFQRIPGKFAYSGMSLHHPPDRMPPGRCPLLFNLQQDTLTGALGMRPPIAQVATTASGLPTHSIARLNDSIANSFARFVGAGTKLFAGQSGALAQVDSGYSGNPLALIPYRPAQSAEPQMYAYDSARQQAFTVTGAGRNVGIQAPTAEPSLARAQPLYTLLEDGSDSASLWSGGTASGGSVSAASVVDRIPSGATIGVILYDSGSSGMATIAPSASLYSWMTDRSIAYLGSGGSKEIVYLEQAFPAYGSTTVSAIAYDSGSTGLCTIVPANPLPGLQRNMMLNLNSGTYVRVISVTAGPDGSYSFRCNTGATTISATQTIAGLPSFRCWCANTHASGAAITGDAINFTFTPAASGGSMQDIVATNLGTYGPVNLQAAGSRPLQNEDYIHLSIGFDQPSYVTQVYVMLDVDEPGASSPTNNFTRNYYYYVLQQGNFALAEPPGATFATGVTMQQEQYSSISGALANELTGLSLTGLTPVQPPFPAPEQPTTAPPSPTSLVSGSQAWFEATFKLSDMTRVGTDPAATLGAVRSIGLYVFTSGGVVNLYFGGWWAGGGYGPDCNFNSYGNQAPPLQWRYRYRNSSTGAQSTVSPETRNGEILRRQAANLTAAASPDPQVDYVDWERRGGTNPDWHYVGSQPVSAGYTFLDTVTEAAAQIADPLEVTSYQPWPVTDVAHTGTCTVTGTSVVWASGSKFNTRWLRGSEIVLAGNTYSLFAPPTSATVLQLAESAIPPPGTYAFLIPEATIEGQPLYGAWLDEQNNRICAVGDPLNPGWMYFSNSDNPDGASDSGYIEITSPSEPLLNGFYAEGSNYVFTNSSLYRVESTPGATNPYTPYRLSGVEGMAGPWAFDAQRRLLFYWGPDGIYGYAFGPAADNLSDADLYPLFPHAGLPGQAGTPGVPVTVTDGYTVYPPNYSAVSQMRVGYSESFVYASFLNSQGVVSTLTWSLGSKGWRLDDYTPAATMFWLEKGIPNPALLAGGYDGNLYEVDTTGNATADTGGAIEWAVIPSAMDAGDSRAVKQWGDLMLDYASSGAIRLEVLWDNLLVTGVNNPAAATGINTRTHLLFDLFAPPDTNDTPLIHFNFTAAITGTGPVWLYELQPSYLPLPEITTSRVTDWSGSGGLHYKFVQGMRLHFNTFGQAKQLQVQYDGYQIGTTVTVNANGEQTQPFSFQAPFKAHMLRLVPLDDVPWEVWNDSEWIYEPEPEPASYWIGQPAAFGQQGWLHAREMWLAFASPNAGATVSVIVDGVLTTLATLPAAASPVKQYFPLPPLKGRYWQPTASGPGLQIYENDLEFAVKSWGSDGPYVRVKPFGDKSGGAGASGARI